MCDTEMANLPPSGNGLDWLAHTQPYQPTDGGWVSEDARWPKRWTGPHHGVLP